MATHLEVIAGANGCELIADTDARTSKRISAIVVQEDTVISTLTYSKEWQGTGTDALSDIGLSGKTLVKGAFITAGVGRYFTAITLASGSVIAY